MSTICYLCEGRGTTYGPRVDCSGYGERLCVRCKGARVFVSRARAGLADPIRTPVELWSTEALKDVVFRDDYFTGKRTFADLFFPDHVRFEDLPPKKSRGDLLVISTGAPPADYIPCPRIKWTSFDCVDEPVLTGDELEAMNERVRTRMADVGAAMHRKAEMMMRAALTGEPVKPHPDDVIGKIGDVELTHADYERWQKMLAEHGVTISVHENRITMDFESYSGTVPGVYGIGDWSIFEQRITERRVEFLPHDDKPNPKPKKGKGYHGDWKQGQRRGRR